MNIKKDTIIANSAAPNGGLVLKLNNIPAKGICAHFLQSNNDAHLIFSGDLFELFCGLPCDAQFPSHAGVCLRLHTRRV